MYVLLGIGIRIVAAVVEATAAIVATATGSVVAAIASADAFVSVWCPLRTAVYADAAEADVELARSTVDGATVVRE